MSEGGSESELEYSRKSNSTMHSTQTQIAPQHIIPPALTSRRQRPPSLMPTAPPPAQALPPAPPISQSYMAQAVSSRPQNPSPSSAVPAHSLPVGYSQQNNVYSHPYSPHPYATNGNPKQSPSRDSSDAAYPATSYRQSLQQLYHSSRQPILQNHRQSHSPSTPSSTSNSSILSTSVGLGITLPSTTPNGYSDQPLSGFSSELSPRRFRDSRPGPTSSVPAGSYFAAYPSSSSRDRSNSANSHSSLGARSMTTSTPNLHSPGAVSPSSLHSAPNHMQSTDSISPNSSSSQAGRSQRPSSRRALTAALELAKAAVQLDATNEDPHGAVVAYARSVQLLGEVMERVMRGEDASGSGHAGATDGEERRRGGRRRSVVAKEEEVRRLKAIHDTYADRMRILCLIYSIQDPLPAANHPRASRISPTSTASTSLSPQGLSSATSVASTVTSYEPSASTQNAPSVIPSQRLLKLVPSSEELHTPSDDQRTPGRNNDWEMVDSDWERLGSDRENVRRREREQPLRESATDKLRETSFDVNEAIGNVMLRGAALQPPQHQPPTRPTIRKSVSNTSITSRQEARTPPSPYVSQSHAEPPVPVPAVRASMVPPPRPPPSTPLPTRPRGSSAAPAFPSQVLNQPLSKNNAPAIMEPPIPGSHSSSNASVSPTTSGSSSGSIPPISISTLAPPIQASTTGAGGGRARGNSNAHRRTPSNSDRLGALNEEQEEDNSSASVHSSVLPAPPQGPREGNYRSRSSSMVSLKDRERTKAQVQAAVQQAQPPLPAPPLALLQQRELPSTPSSPTSATSNAALPMPPTPRRPSVDYYQQFTPGPTRGRGNSLGSNVTHSSEDLVTPSSEHSPGATPVAHTTVGSDATKQAGGQIVSNLNPPLDTQSIKISTTTTGGVISQRRQKNPEAGTVSAASSTTDLNASTTRLTSQQLPPSTATSLGLTGRSRAVSNPGRRPTNLGITEQPARPPIPMPPLSAGLKRHFPGRFTPLMQTISSPVVPTVYHPLTGDAPTAGKPLSPPAPAPPHEAVLRPYYLMSLLRKSMVDRTGGFVTPKLHVPNEVWTQGGAKLQNHADKMKALDILATALDELSTASVEFCGAGGVNGLSGALGRNEAERWASKLEDFDRSLSQVGEMYGKKLGVGEGFVAKKTGGMAALTGKFTRGLDRMTTGKNYDSPASYVTMLIKFFGQAQVLDDHTKALISHPVGAAYANLSPGIRTRVDMLLKNISDLFARVVLTFVFQDLSVLLVKYGKTCNQWLEGNT